MTFLDAILLSAMALQFGAGYLILRFVVYSERALAWMAIVIALIMMSSQTFMAVIESPEHLNEDLIHWVNSVVTFIISALLFGGLSRIGPVLRSRVDREAEIGAKLTIMENVLTHSPTAIAARDLNGKFLIVNKAYEKAVGMPREEIIGKHTKDLLIPEFADRIEELDQKIAMTGEHVVHEHEVPLLNSGERFLSVRFPVRNSNGEIISIGTIGTNVTEMHQVRERLQIQQDRYERATEAARVGVWEWNLLTGEIYVAPNLERMLGCVGDEHIGHIDQWYEKLEPGLEEGIRQKVEKYLAGQLHEEEVSMYSVKLTNGDVRWFETRSLPVVEPNGKVMRLIGTDTEITLRREMEVHAREREALLNAILENIPVGIVIKDKEFRFESVNKTYLEWNGVRSIDLIGNRLEEMPWFQADNDDSLVKEHELAVLNGEEIIERLSIRKFADGESHVIRVTKFPIHDANGEVERIGSVSVDISEQIQIQEELEATNQRLDAANKAKSEFLAHMSHELRTPLNSVIGFSQMMQAETLGKLGNPAYKDYSGYIYTSAAHLLDVINDILDISKIEAGEFGLDEAPVDLDIVTSDAMTLASQRALGKTLEVRSDIPSGIPKLLGDERMIKQVIINLLSNALKFTPDGGEIAISAKCDPDRRLLLSVRDTGVGMAEQDIPRVLQPFEQIRQSARLSHGGTGLGLSLSKKLVELHDAELIIKSEIGVGTTVTIMFPEARTIELN